MRTRLKGVLTALHAMRMDLDSFFKENEEALRFLKLKDELGWVDTYQWRLMKSLEAFYNAEKTIGRMVQALPRVKKSKLDRTIEVTKKDLLINLLNMISNRLEVLMIDEEEVSIEVLLELQEVLSKITQSSE